jgi:class 3 adenylate cyclase
MRGFTTMSEGMTPRGLVQVMNRYFSTMSQPIRAHRGVIDKYIGDAIMAYWGPPFVSAEEEARLACEAALEMAARVAPLREEMPELLGVKLPDVDCDVRIGIATGDVLVGSIGSELMMSYTVMGDAVNVASRLENANTVYGTRILASDAAVASLDAEFTFREIDRLLLAGQRRAASAFELMGRAGDVTSEQMRLRESYAEGLAAYRARRWDEARQAFGAALAAVPGDGPSQVMLERLTQMDRNPPGDDWDGSWSLAK